MCGISQVAENGSWQSRRALRQRSFQGRFSIRTMNTRAACLGKCYAVTRRKDYHLTKIDKGLEAPCPNQLYNSSSSLNPIPTIIGSARTTRRDFCQVPWQHRALCPLLQEVGWDSAPVGWSY